MNSLPNLLILEGGIAAGKTSLLHNLANEYNLYALEEPVTDNPYLAKFYEDPKKWSFEFQMWFLEQRIQHYKHACQIAIEQPNNIVILDRSVFSDSVFARLAFQDGFISQNQFDQYLIKYNDIVSKIPLPTAVVYLDVSPETCLYRIKNIRKRDYEMNIQVEYLEGLDACYKILVQQLKGMGCRVYNVDWTMFGSTSTIYNIYESAKTCLAE